jgi:hypothetical protein
MSIDIRDGTATKNIEDIFNRYGLAIDSGGKMPEIIAKLAGVAWNTALAAAESLVEDHPEFPESSLPNGVAVHRDAILLATGAALGFAAALEAQAREPEQGNPT